jgi:thiamine biosynthesis protein ThiS
LLVQVNGESREVRDRSTLDDLVCELALPAARIAIELNHQVVRRNKWPETTLSEGDQLEIVHFVGGGMPRFQESGAVSNNGEVALAPFLISVHSGVES